MYPDSPDKPTVRRAAADLARKRGAPIPASFDGSDKAMQALMKSGPQHFAALTYAHNEYTRENPGSFPPEHVAAAEAWLAKNPSPTGYASRYTLEKNTLGTQVAEFGKDLGHRVLIAAVENKLALDPRDTNPTKPNPESTIQPEEGGIKWGTIFAGALVTGLVGAVIHNAGKGS